MTTTTIDAIAERVRDMLYMQLQQYERQIAAAGTSPDVVKRIGEMVPDVFYPPLFGASPSRTHEEIEIAAKHALSDLRYLDKADVDGALVGELGEVQVTQEWVDLIKDFARFYPERSPAQVLLGKENATATDLMNAILDANPIRSTLVPPLRQGG